MPTIHLEHADGCGLPDNAHFDLCRMLGMHIRVSSEIIESKGTAMTGGHNIETRVFNLDLPVRTDLVEYHHSLRDGLAVAIARVLEREGPDGDFQIVLTFGAWQSGCVYNRQGQRSPDVEPWFSKALHPAIIRDTLADLVAMEEAIQSFEATVA